MQLKSLEAESSRDFYDQLLDSLTITTDHLSDPNILKDAHVYFCDLGHVCERLEQFRNTFNKVQPCYPVECNDAKELLTVLANSGVSFCCSNKQNVKSVCDVSKAKSAMFGSASVQKSHLKYALESGIEVMTLQTELELKKLTALQLPSSCRFIVQFNWECPEVSALADHVQQMKKLIKVAQKKQMQIVGVSLGQIPGRMMENINAIVEASVSVLSFMESIGLPIRMFDLGNYCSLTMPAPNMNSSESSGVINSVLDEVVFSRWPSLMVLADVGRLIARSAFSLMVTVTGIDTNYSLTDTSSPGVIEQPDGGCVYINDSVYGSFSKILLSSQKTSMRPKLMISPQGVGEISPGSENVSAKAQEQKAFCVRGKTGDASDIVSYCCLMSKDLQIGDKLLFEDMGDFHCVVRTANGNGETPPVVLSFINADQLEIAKRLKRKTFSFKCTSADNEERLSCRQALNVGTCPASCVEELTRSDYDVIFENMALLEQNHMSARHFDSSDVLARFDPEIDVDVAMFEQVHYQQNPFAFI